MGSLLNAHPDVLISHELDALAFVEAGASRQELVELIADRDMEFASLGRRWEGHEYALAADQGVTGTREPVVIGDKKGGGTTDRLAANPGLLDALRITVGVPLVAIHVTRNPFDMIASNLLARRRRPPSTSSGRARNMVRRGLGPIGNAIAVRSQVDKFLRRMEVNAEIRSRLDSDEVVELALEDLVADPRAGLTQLVSALGVELNPGWLNTCEARVDSQPSAPRTQIRWPRAEQRRLRARLAEDPLLARYELAVG